MEILTIVLVAGAVWVIIAVVIGRTSAASEHTYQLGALARETRAAEDARVAALESEANVEQASVAREPGRVDNAGSQL